MDDLFHEMQRAADRAGDLIAVVAAQASVLGVDAPQLLTDAAWELWTLARLPVGTKHKGLPWPRTFIPTTGASDMERRRFLAGVVATAGAVISETSIHPPTAATLASLRGSTEGLRALNAAGAARGNLGPMLRHVQALDTATRRATDGGLKRELLVAYGDALTLLARFLNTAGLAAQARRATAAAIQAADAAGHGELAAYAFGMLAQFHAHHLTDLSGARGLVDSGQGKASGATWLTRGWLAAQRAEVLSMMGDQAGTLAALDEAHVCMDESAPATGLPWLGPGGGFESVYDVYGYDGACAIRFGDAATALAALQAALDRRGDDAGRRGAVLVDLGGAYAVGKEPEAACTVLGDALGRVRAWRSVNLFDRLVTVRPLLDPWQGERFVMELDEQIAATAAVL